MISTTSNSSPMTSSSTSNTNGTSTSTSNTNRNTRREVKRKRDEEVKFTDSQLKVPIVEYLLGHLPPFTSQTETVTELLGSINSDLQQISLQQIINIFAGKECSEHLIRLSRIVHRSDVFTRAFRHFIQHLFMDQRPQPEIDIIESNLSLMRHFLRELSSCLDNGTKLAKYIVQFVNLWIALNCDILRGGPNTLEKCIRSQIVLKPHPDKYLTRFIQWSRSQATSIDGYVMSEKIIDEMETNPIAAACPKPDRINRESPISPGSPEPRKMSQEKDDGETGTGGNPAVEPLTSNGLPANKRRKKS